MGRILKNQGSLEDGRRLRQGLLEVKGESWGVVSGPESRRCCETWDGCLRIRTARRRIDIMFRVEHIVMIRMY
jgi:hypothetical protein